MHANLELTRLCNQSCVYCFNDSGPARVNANIGVNWTGVIDTLSRHGFRSVHFTGGEPFLVKGLLDLMRAALDRKLKISVLSNGYSVPRLLEDPSKRSVFAQLQVAQISLDSMDSAVHDRRRGKAGARAHAVSAIQALRKSHVPIEISCVVDEENEEDIEALAIFALDQGANLILRPRVSAGRAADMPGYVVSRKLRTVLSQFRHLLTDDRFHYVPRGRELCRGTRDVVTLKANGEITGDLSIFPPRARFNSDGRLATA